MKLTARGASDEARQLIPVLDRHAEEGVSWAKDPCIPGYAMVKPLGINGAEVYLGVQLATGTQVVLKVWTGWRSDYQRREAAATRLRHRSILTVFEAGEIPRGPFAVLEWIGPDASTLSSKIRSRTLRAREAVAVVDAVARALEYARTQGMRLGAFGPPDVVFTDANTVKVMPVFVDDDSPSSSVRDDLNRIGLFIAAVVEDQATVEPWTALRDIGLRCIQGTSEVPLDSMSKLTTLLAELVAAVPEDSKSGPTKG